MIRNMRSPQNINICCGPAEPVPLTHNNVVPHYLIYTTLGRADLVRFESFMDDCIERGMKLNSHNSNTGR